MRISDWSSDVCASDLKAGISEYVTPNFYIFIDVRQFVPNDPLFDRQWPLDNTGQNNGLEDADIDADLAWEFGTGDSSTIIAVIDGGFDMAHPDLVPNFFMTTGETAGNNVDDEGNGYVDDRTGRTEEHTSELKSIMRRS